jgi:hypothetical protein
LYGRTLDLKLLLLLNSLPAEQAGNGGGGTKGGVISTEGKPTISWRLKL